MCRNLKYVKNCIQNYLNFSCFAQKRRLIKHKKEGLLTNAGVSELVSQTHDNYKMFKSYLVLNFNYVSYLIRH